FGVATLRVGPDELQRLGPALPPGGHHLAAEVEPVPHAAPQVVHRVGPQLEPAVEGELVAGTDDATLGDGPGDHLDDGAGDGRLETDQQQLRVAVAVVQPDRVRPVA